MLVPRKVNTMLVVFALTIAAVGVGTFVLLGGLEPAEGITVITQGNPVVGSAFRFVLTVRAPAALPPWQVYLSVSGLNGTFEMSPEDAVGHPWGCANVWNLTGMDLSHARTVMLNTVPIWAAESVHHAILWSPMPGFSAESFLQQDMWPQGNISLYYKTSVRVTTTWPLAASMTPQGPFILGQPAQMHVSVRDAGIGVSIPSLRYLSVVTKPMYYTLAATGTSANPWNATTLWNLTGIDLSHGFDVDLTATPEMAGKGIGLDVIVWSPLGSVSAVALDGDGMILTPGAVRLWVDLSFSFPVTSP